MLRGGGSFNNIKMKIVPLSDIAIRGVHCPAGVPVDVADHEGRDLVAQRIAKMALPAERSTEQAVPDTASKTKAKPRA
jgi:hypothetical protein